VTFHRESSGGEKFFQILDRVMAEPQRYIALIELLYTCLSLGFEGRYRLDERGPIRLAEIRNNLYRVIQGVRGPAEADLSPRWKGVEDRRNAVVRLVPLWVVAAACGILLLAAFIVFSARLSSRADGLNATLAGIGLEPLYTPVAPVPAVSLVSFKTLLAQQIAAGTVAVDENPDGRTAITITAPDLFASASVNVNPGYGNLITEIGAAAEKVPGQVLVVGHTDDQPLRSLRYQDNFELSRARAVEVANLLKTQIRDPSRVDFAGKGSSEPRFKPESTPENRARNRRVEIIHRRIG
jgi:type VI secretion system protein ImpK